MNTIHRYLDAAVLKPEFTRSEAEQAIRESLSFTVRTVCVRPCDIDTAVRLCEGSQTDVSCVLGFPHGVILSASKTEEAKRYIGLGVKEIDMVVNYGFILSDRWDAVEEDIRAVTEYAKPAGVLVKVILETSRLDIPRIKTATATAIKADADFVKTSTGFYGEGATVEAVRAMGEAAAGKILVKASGGIRDTATAMKFIELGCSRLGVHYASVAPICTGAESTVLPDSC